MEKKRLQALNMQDIRGRTPLHSAVINHHLDTVECLLKYGADPNLKDVRSRAPLHSAVMNPGIVELLLKHGADVNTLDSSHLSPLHHALSRDKPDISVIKTLVKYGANVTAVNAYEKNVLYVAVCNPTTPCEIIKFLLENGAKPDFDESNNILVNIEPNRQHIADIVLPYISVRKVEESIANGFGNLDYYSLLGYIMDQFKVILSGNALEQLSDIYKYCTEIAAACVAELLIMRNDVLPEGQTLFQFVSENCSRATPLNQESSVRVIDEVLLRWKAEKYVLCKDLLYSSIKYSTLLEKVCELSVKSTTNTGTVLTLHSPCINNIAKNLSKEDIINMIIAYSDTFRPCKDPIIPSSSKRNIVDDDEEEHQSKRLRK